MVGGSSKDFHGHASASGSPQGGVGGRKLPAFEGSLLLPPWMKSAVPRFRQSDTYAENRVMESLKSRYVSLSRHVKGLRQEDMVHVVGGCFCPVLTLYGTPRFHSSNGIFMAIVTATGGGDSKQDKNEEDQEEEEEVKSRVYASCPNCRYDGKARRGGGGNKAADSLPPMTEMIVPGTENSSHPWVEFTEEGYHRIMEMACSSSSSPPPAAGLLGKTKRVGMEQQHGEEGTLAKHTKTHPAAVVRGKMK